MLLLLLLFLFCLMICIIIKRMTLMMIVICDIIIAARSSRHFTQIYILVSLFTPFKAVTRLSTKKSKIKDLIFHQIHLSKACNHILYKSSSNHGLELVLNLTFIFIYRRTSLSLLSLLPASCFPSSCSASSSLSLS